MRFFWTTKKDLRDRIKILEEVINSQVRTIEIQSVKINAYELAFQKGNDIKYAQTDYDIRGGFPGIPGKPAR